MLIFFQKFGNETGTSQKSVQKPQVAALKAGLVKFFSQGKKRWVIDLTHCIKFEPEDTQREVQEISAWASTQGAELVTCAPGSLLSDSKQAAEALEAGLSAQVGEAQRLLDREKRLQVINAKAQERFMTLSSDPKFQSVKQLKKEVGALRREVARLEELLHSSSKTLPPEIALPVEDTNTDVLLMSQKTTKLLEHAKIFSSLDASDEDDQ